MGLRDIRHITVASRNAQLSYGVGMAVVRWPGHYSRRSARSGVEFRKWGTPPVHGDWSLLGHRDGAIPLAVDK